MEAENEDVEQGDASSILELKVKFWRGLRGFCTCKKYARPAYTKETADAAIDSLSTKRYLQRKLNPNETKISQPMAEESVANSPLLIGFYN